MTLEELQMELRRRLAARPMMPEPASAMIYPGGSVVSSQELEQWIHGQGPGLGSAIENQGAARRSGVASSRRKGGKRR